jgi:hypothetical protein
MRFIRVTISTLEIWLGGINAYKAPMGTPNKATTRQAALEAIVKKTANKKIIRLMN